MEADKTEHFCPHDETAPLLRMKELDGAINEGQAKLKQNLKVEGHQRSLEPSGTSFLRRLLQV